MAVRRFLGPVAIVYRKTKPNKRWFTIAIFLNGKDERRSYPHVVLSRLPCTSNLIHKARYTYCYLNTYIYTRVCVCVF